MPTGEPLYENIRREREAAGVSLVALADALGVSKQYMSQIETGKIRVTAEFLRDVARALGVSVARIFGEKPGATRAA